MLNDVNCVLGWWSTVATEWKLSALMLAWPVTFVSAVAGYGQSGMLLALMVTLAVGTLEVLVGNIE